MNSTIMSCEIQIIRYFVFCVFVVIGVACQEQIKINIDLGKNELKEPWKSLLNAVTEKSVKAAGNLVETKEDIENAQKLVCPGKKVQPPFFSLPCLTTENCAIFRDDQLICCKNRCVKGIEPPKPAKKETKHPATFFGIVQQTCPNETIPELREIEECTTDADCDPRICCLETLMNGTTVGFCRTPQPIWESIPIPKDVVDPIRNIVSYMQCSAPPPAPLDLFPKPCDNPLDCFPNLCCQEGGKKYCRPPVRSLLTFIADVGQRIIPTDVARDFIKRIS